MGFMDIFSTDAVSDMVSGVIDTADALVYTEEEKATMRDKIIEFKFEHLSKNGNFQLAQRYLAFVFAANFILSFWVAFGFMLLAEQKLFDNYIALVVSFNIGWIMMAIISFYFSGGFIESFKKKNKK